MDIIYFHSSLIEYVDMLNMFTCNKISVDVKTNNEIYNMKANIKNNGRN